MGEQAQQEDRPRVLLKPAASLVVLLQHPPPQASCKPVGSIFCTHHSARLNPWRRALLRQLRPRQAARPGQIARPLRRRQPDACAGASPHARTDAHLGATPSTPGAAPHPCDSWHLVFARRCREIYMLPCGFFKGSQHHKSAMFSMPPSRVRMRVQHSWQQQDAGKLAHKQSLHEIW